MSEIITDASGRKIALRKITVLDQVRLLRAIGPAQAENKPYTDIVMMAAMVSEVGGVPMLIPTNERQIDAAVERIGSEGFAALQVYMVKAVDDIMAAAAAAAGDGEGKPSDPLAPSGS